MRDLSLTGAERLTNVEYARKEMAKKLETTVYKRNTV